jgi:RNA polymerase sigma factor (sigma-70 family)
MRRRDDPLTDAPRLIRRVHGYVAFRIGPGPDAEDITSEVFERALRYRDSFDAAKGTPTAWLLGIAQHAVDDLFRRRSMQAVTAADDVEAAGRDDSDPLSRVVVQRALTQLGARDRDLLALRYGVGLSTKEVAKVLNLNPGAVDVAVHRARERLSSALAGQEATPPPAAAEASAGGA